MGAERPLLLALPAEPFDACESAAPRVDAKSLVTIRQNRYSVPVALAGLKVSARVGAREITINHGGREVARHERLHGKYGTSAQLDHYLELLARKPGGFEHSLALAQERDRGKWPDCFDELWAALTGRYGRSDAARQMVDVVLLCRDHGPERVALAVRGALTAGAIDGRAVAVLARRADSAPAVQVPPLTGLEARLAAHERPPRTTSPTTTSCTTTRRDDERARLYYCLDAFIEQHQVGYDDDGILCQLVSVIMTDDRCWMDPAVWRLKAKSQELRASEESGYSLTLKPYTVESLAIIDKRRQTHGMQQRVSFRGNPVCAANHPKNSLPRRSHGEVRAREARKHECCSQSRRLCGMSPSRRALGGITQMPDLWPCWLLRFFARAARQ